MGVSGSGKSTIAERLATEINAKFLDADDYHPPANINKMQQGEALNDEDRWPWLEIFGKEMAAQGVSCVGACSSLKRSYREKLSESAEAAILFIYLDGSKELLMQRITGRTDHFMPSTLLESQLDTLEVPDANEFAISISIDGTPDDIIKMIKQEIKA
ncbi:UNVERIFIED_CONTAM: hypothetical protein GTU68_035914 [Idotea baltica]|nr:hypothetical protein [Idotea baltica]